MIGAGTISDPKRPLFTPASGIKPAVPAASHSLAMAARRAGIIAYHAQVSDDGKMALVEFVAPSLDDVQEILTTPDARVQLFRRGTQNKMEIEAAFRLLKKDFSFATFRMMGAR